MGAPSTRCPAFALWANRHARGCVAAACAMGLLLAGGCGGGGPSRSVPLAASGPAATQQAFPDDAGTRAAALRVLDSLQRSALEDAFGTLEARTYTRRLRTEQLAPSGQVNAFEEHTVRYGPAGRLRVVRSDSAGAFDFGLLGRFASASMSPPLPDDLMQQVLPEELPFLSQRNRHAFQYRLLPDTTLAGGPARVVAVRARPGDGDGGGEEQAVRRARLYLDRDTRQLVALRMHLAQRSLFFDEDTQQYVRIRPAPESQADGGAWVPAETRFQTHLHMLLHPARRFRAAASYRYPATPG